MRKRTFHLEQRTFPLGRLIDYLIVGGRWPWDFSVCAEGLGKVYPRFKKPTKDLPRDIWIQVTDERVEGSVELARVEPISIYDNPRLEIESIPLIKYVGMALTHSAQRALHDLFEIWDTESVYILVMYEEVE